MILHYFMYICYVHIYIYDSCLGVGVSSFLQHPKIRWVSSGMRLKKKTASRDQGTPKNKTRIHRYGVGPVFFGSH